MIVTATDASKSEHRRPLRGKLVFVAILLVVTLRLAVSPLAAQERPTFTLLGLDDARAGDIQPLADILNRQGGLRGMPIVFERRALSVGSPDATPYNANASVVIGPAVASDCGRVLATSPGSALRMCLAASWHPQKSTLTFSSESGLAARNLLLAIARYARARGWSHIELRTASTLSQDDLAELLQALGFVGNLDETRSLRFVTTSADAVPAADAQAVICWCPHSSLDALVATLRNLPESTPIVIYAGTIEGGDVSAFPGDLATRGTFAGYALQAEAGTNRLPFGNGVPRLYSGDGWAEVEAAIDALRMTPATAPPVARADFLERTDFEALPDGRFATRVDGRSGTSFGYAGVFGWNANSRTWSKRLGNASTGATVLLGRLRLP